MKILRTLPIFLVLAAAWGCRSSKTEGGEHPSSETNSRASVVHDAQSRIANPCKLLTQAEASEAIGVKLNSGVLKKLGTITRCSFDSGDPDEKLWLDVQNESAPASDSELFDSLTHGPGVKLVTGIGDRALWAHDQFSTFLYILKGGNMVAMGLPRKMATMTPGVEKAGKLVASRVNASE